MLIFDTPGEAILHIDATRVGTAVLLESQAMVVSASDADRLNAASIDLTYLRGHRPSKRLRAIPSPLISVRSGHWPPVSPMH